MILIVTEKNDTAKRIADILSGGKAKKDAYFKVPIYDFKSNGSSYRCIGLKGHILNVDYPEKFNKWQETELKELIHAPVIKNVSQKNIVNALKKSAREADEVIIATDYDREGELIGFEAIDTVKSVNDLDMKRARYSSLTKQEITEAFSNLSEPSRELADAGGARQEIDLVWGAVLTRFVSLAAKRLGTNLLSVGRVQTPTLALLVEREKERQAFESKPYWELYAFFEAEEKPLKTMHGEERFWEQDKVEKINASLRGDGTVTSVKKTQKKTRPPAPFDTTAFQRAASSIGFRPSNAMRTAESLYMKGYISYPRTDNTVYPETLDLRELVSMFRAGEEFSGEARELLAKGTLTATRGKRQTTDHPPIYPTEYVSRSRLNDYEWKIYELVVRRFFATLSEESVTESMRIDIELAGQGFFTSGSHVVHEGFLRFYPYSRKKDEELPAVKEGQVLPFIESRIDAKETQPPNRYKQGGLVGEMEKRGLGTKATRPGIIDTLELRGYIHSDPIVVTETGIALIESLKKHAENITTPEMTAALESDMDEISEGRKPLEKVVSHSREMLEGVIDILEAHRDEVSQEISVGIRSDKIIGKCRVCGSDLRMIRSKKTKKRFVGCSGYPECHETFPLPQMGEIIPTGEICTGCESPKIKVIKKGSRPWELCIDPKCPTKEQKERPPKKEPAKKVTKKK